jgi:hypothetical protein
MLFFHPETLDPGVREDLEFTLCENSNKIQKQYASYVYNLCECLKRQGITTTQLYTFVQRQPLPGKIHGLKEAATLNDIFDLIGDQCASFFHYDVYQSIQDEFCSDTENPNLKYSERFKAFINLHKISEFFSINPKLRLRYSAGSELALKVGNIQMSDKIVKAVDLKHTIAKTLKRMPSEIQLVTIEDGCVVMKFLVSTAIRSALTELSLDQKKDLQHLSILFLECGDYRLDLSFSGGCDRYAHACKYV